MPVMVVLVTVLIVCVARREYGERINTRCSRKMD